MAIRGIFFDAADVFYYRPMSTDGYALNLVPIFQKITHTTLMR